MSVKITEEQLDTLISSKRMTFTSCKAIYTGVKDLEVLETFLSEVNVFKELEKIKDKEALSGLPLLLKGEAGKWWQGIKGHVSTWQDFENRLRNTFAPRKSAWSIYQEISSEKQDQYTLTEDFIRKKRMLFSLLPQPHHSETVQLDMLYSLLHVQIREKIPRITFSSFDELLEAARGHEAVLAEKASITTIRAGPPPSSSRNKVKCNYCRCMGHSIDDCRKKKRVEEKQVGQHSTASNQFPSPGQPKFSCYGCGAPGVVRTNCVNCSQSKTSVKIDEIEFCSFSVRAETRPRPVVHIGVMGIKGIAHIDTCAKTSVASYSLYRRLQEVGVIFRPETVNVVLADGVERKQQVFTARVPVNLQNAIIPTTFVVLPDSRHNKTLLGIGFLQNAMMVLNLAQMTWSFAHNPEKTHELFEEDFFVFNEKPQQSRTATTLIQKHSTASVPITPTLPANVMSPTKPDESCSAFHYQLAPVEMRTPPRSTTVFDGFEPRYFSRTDYMLEDAQFNVNCQEVELSPHSQSLFPGEDPYANLDIGSIDIFTTDLQNTAMDDSQLHQVNELLQTFEDVFEDNGLPVKGIEHRIETIETDETLPYRIKSDASGYAIGAVLLQGEGADERPVEFASKLLTATTTPRRGRGRPKKKQ